MSDSTALEQIASLQFTSRRETAVESIRSERAAMMEQLSARGLARSGAVITGFRNIVAKELRVLSEGTATDLLGLLEDLPSKNRLEHVEWARTFYETHVRGITEGFEEQVRHEYERLTVPATARILDGEYLRGRRSLDVALGKMALRTRATAASRGEPVDVSGRDYDIFISHASEDKEPVVRPLKAALEAAGFTVWLDEHEILLGDNIVTKVQEGITKSRFVVAVLSPSFFSKAWPMNELSAMIAIGYAEERVTVLPILYDLSYDEARTKFPLLAGTSLYRFDDGLDGAVAAISKVLERLSRKG